MPTYKFVKSSYSAGGPVQECVEVAQNIPGVIAVRDSKDPASPILQLTPATWTTFTATVGLRGTA
jgi:hypothetical protein